IDSNIVVAASNNGIWIVTSTFGSILGNIARNCGNDGIHIEGTSTDMHVGFNRSLSNTATGIFIDNTGTRNTYGNNTSVVNGTQYNVGGGVTDTGGNV